jgi:hypothetical protein
VGPEPDQPPGDLAPPMAPPLLSLARSTKGFMPDDEGLALYRAGFRAASLGLGPLVEIGAYCGKSTVYLGAAARAAGSLLVSVDHHRGSEECQPGWEHHDPSLVDPARGLMDTLPWWRQTVEQAGLEASVIGVVGDSATVAGLWAGPASLVFIDGGHGSAVAWADYRGWAPKVAVGALLAIHDVFPDPACGGRPPYELWCRALESGAFVEESSCGSLRVLKRVDEGI